MTVENFNKTKIKICGLRRREDILAVNEAKPDYCGFIIEFPKSIRSVTADEVRELVNDLSPDIQPVGVFVNAPMELVKALMDEGTLAMAQLHGQENESYITELKAHTDKPVIKAFCIKKEEDVRQAERSPADFILLDSGAGTGRTFEWEWIKHMERPYFLAGGIHIDNVEKALEQLKPYAIDVSSGIETEGRKDKRKMAAIMTAVRKERKL